MNLLALPHLIPKQRYQWFSPAANLLPFDKLVERSAIKVFSVVQKCITMNLNHTSIRCLSFRLVYIFVQHIWSSDGQVSNWLWQISSKLLTRLKVVIKNIWNCHDKKVNVFKIQLPWKLYQAPQGAYF